MKKEMVWLNEPNANSLQIAVQHLDRAFQDFFKGKGYPQFKNKLSVQSASTGEKIDNPRFLNKSLKRLRRLSRQHSKKKKGRKKPRKVPPSLGPSA